MSQYGLKFFIPPNSSNSSNLSHSSHLSHLSKCKYCNRNASHISADCPNKTCRVPGCDVCAPGANHWCKNCRKSGVSHFSRNCPTIQVLASRHVEKVLNQAKLGPLDDERALHFHPVQSISSMLSKLSVSPSTRLKFVGMYVVCSGYILGCLSAVHGRYGQPDTSGGSIELNEMPEQAAYRETKEEFGLDISQSKLIEFDRHDTTICYYCILPNYQPARGGSCTSKEIICTNQLQNSLNGACIDLKGMHT